MQAGPVFRTFQKRPRQSVVGPLFNAAVPVVIRLLLEEGDAVLRLFREVVVDHHVCEDLGGFVVVFNTFVWPTSEKSRSKIERTAQGILDARSHHPQATLAEMYGDDVMPANLRKAHRENDRAVLEAYGLSPDSTEKEIVDHLLQLYSQKVIEVERREAVEAAARKALGKSAAPDGFEALKAQALDGKLSVEDFLDQAKALKKAAKKR